MTPIERLEELLDRHIGRSAGRAQINEVVNEIGELLDPGPWAPVVAFIAEHFGSICPGQHPSGVALLLLGEFLERRQRFGPLSVTLSGTFESDLREVLGDVLRLLLAKNAAYGDSALSPLRVFSRADTVEQLKVRLDDKLSRLARGTGEETEDVEADLLGYLVLLRVARLRAKRGAA